jgi:hypothetical protein
MLNKVPFLEDVSESVASPFITSAVHVGEWSASLTGRFIPGERVPDTHYVADCMGSRAGLDAMEKGNIICRESNPYFKAVQLVARF